MALLLFMIFLPLDILMRGYTLATLWNWYMPTVFGLVTVSIPGALGVSLIVALFKGVTPSKKNKDDKRSASMVFVEVFINNVTLNVVALFFGWLYKHWL